MGQIIRADVNASSIFQGQQPIGLYSHRGHAAIALATITVLAIIGRMRQLTSDRSTAIAYLVFALTWFDSAEYAHIPWWAISTSVAFFHLKT